MEFAGSYIVKRNAEFRVVYDEVFVNEDSGFINGDA